MTRYIPPNDADFLAWMKNFFRVAYRGHARARRGHAESRRDSERGRVVEGERRSP
jgi:hypothetical protein